MTQEGEKFVLPKGLIRSSLVPRVQFSEISEDNPKREQEDVTTCRRDKGTPLG